jgi:hypothetical protein
MNINNNKSNNKSNNKPNSRFSSLSENPRKNTFKKNNNSRKRRDTYDTNNYNNNNYNYNNYNNYNNTFSNLEQQQPKRPEIIVPLAKIDPNTIKEPQLNYLEKCKERQEEEKKKGLINTKNSKYWRKNIWIGPILLKSVKSEYWENYYKTIKNNPPSSILAPTNVLYSRDNENWYNSYKETFTEEEWELMQQQKDLELTEKLEKEAYKRGEIFCRKRDKESWDYYQETGELDSWALAKRDMIEHENYCNKLEEEMLQEEDEYSEDSE